MFVAVIMTLIYYAITLHEDPMFRKMFSSFLVKARIGAEKEN
jgi:lipopolysaccharide exporter